MLIKMRKAMSGEKGFTLIELMIVVAIIGILAAIAIPNFLRYQLKSKTTEAKTNIGGIKVSEESYKAEYDAYYSCTASPDAVPGSSKRGWVNADGAGAGFDAVGFAPAGNVYYSYEVEVANDVSGNRNGDMAIGVFGDLDGDGANGQFVYTSTVTQIDTTTNTGTATTSRIIQDVNAGVW